ncbi:MAG TPA: hypothetical protein VGK26_10760 [Thermoanaerobaculia bacterium]|jgi:hypothetical protein
MRTATVESASLRASASPVADHANTGIYLRGKTFWIRYHGPRRNGTWGQICESARTSDPDEARRLRERRLHEVSDHREGIHLFRGPYQARSAFSLKS